MNDVVIYTDGACRGNPGPGGWAALLLHDGGERILKGAEVETTNNRMELTAAVRALDALEPGHRITLYTDSEYVRTGITEWLSAWKQRGWKTANRKPVKNQDLWQALDKAASRHQVDWRWVRGHTGNAGNERVDQLANSAIDELLGRGR